MAQKVCPRCGSQFATLKSETCPHCFAKLVEVDDRLAAEMAAARAEVEQSDEFRAAKAEDDEVFRHQSFQACLVIIALALVTIFVLIVAISDARHRQSQLGYRQPVIPAPATPSGAPPSVKDVMPPLVGGFRRLEMDRHPLLSGTLTYMYHGSYSAGNQSGGGMDVYAVLVDRPAGDILSFRNAAQAIAHLNGEDRTVSEITAKPFLYNIIGPSDAPSAADAMGQFRKAWLVSVGG